MISKHVLYIMRRAVWAAMSLLLITALLLPAAPTATAQAGESRADGTTAADVSRYATIAQVSSARASETVTVEWSTGYEISIAGFNILVPAGDGFEAVNQGLILSSAIDSLEPQSYRYAADFAADEFYIEPVTLNDESFMRGPYAVGTTVGSIAQPQQTDWTAVRAESEALEQTRETKRAVAINDVLDAVRGPAPSPDEPLLEQSDGVLGERNIFLPLINGSGQVAAADAEVIDYLDNVVAELLVDKDGVYRVTDADLQAKGINLVGVPSAYLALSNQNAPVRIRMVSTINWGQNSYFEFIGEALDTLYTDTNVYLLKVDRANAFRTFRNLRKIDEQAQTPEYYMETTEVEENNRFIIGAKTADPWIWEYSFTLMGTPKEHVYENIDEIDAVAAAGGDAHFTGRFYGGNSANHHIAVSLNGNQVHVQPPFFGEVAANDIVFNIKQRPQ